MNHNKFALLLENNYKFFYTVFFLQFKVIATNLSIEHLIMCINNVGLVKLQAKKK